MGDHHKPETITNRGLAHSDAGKLSCEVALNLVIAHSNTVSTHRCAVIWGLARWCALAACAHTPSVTFVQSRGMSFMHAPNRIV